MKKLYKELFILALAFSTFIFFIEWRIRDIEAPIDRLLLLTKQKTGANLIIVGNSHTGVLSDASDSLFTVNALNLSLSNLELEDRYKVLQYCLKEAAAKTVILGMDADQIGHAYSSASYDMQLKKYGFNLYDNSLGNRVLSNLNFFRLHLTPADLLKYLISGKSSDTSKINFIPFTDKQRSDNEACKKRAEEHSVYIYKKDNVKKNLEILQRIFDLCKSKNVRLYLLQTPKPACYSEVFNNENMKIATAKIDSAAKANRIDFLNFFNDSSFSEDDFADFDHLNAQGSQKLAIKIKAAMSAGAN